MSEEKSKVWWFNRQVNISVLVQLILLASLIIGSWVNLQSRLNLLQHDVNMLLENQKEFCVKVESLQAMSISHECRLKTAEKMILKIESSKVSR